MRSTVTLEDDVAAAVQQLRREEGIGFSAAINKLIRAALIGRRAPKRFRQRSMKMGAYLVDVSNAAEAIELAEGPDHK